MRWNTQLKVTSVFCASLFLAGCGRQKHTINLSSLLSAMTNRLHFAEAPTGVAGMISTYDRTGGNRDWGDFSSARDGGRIVISDLTGPGCVTRIWYTNIPTCKWLFFFDGEREARMALTPADLFRGQPPFFSPFSVSESGGSCLYVPMPYKKSLRIELELEKVPENHRPYYHINYETYPAGTAVTSFIPQLSEKERAIAESVRDFWTELPPLMSAGRVVDFECSETVQPGVFKELLNREGAGVLDILAIRFRGPDTLSAVAKNALLRELWLRIYWDDAAFASVEVPIGDFFCNGLARRRLKTLPIRVTDEWFECGFPMPFRKRARIEILNLSGVPVKVDMKAFFLQETPSDRLRYFHACWNHSRTSGFPYRVLKTEGRGHFAGCYLVSLGMDGSWNNLEGDEVFTVDGVPTLHGTGLEDYFNGGWYYMGLFERPLHGLSEKAAMRTAQYRFHLTTPVAFEKSLECTFEFGTDNRSQAYFSSVAYWYNALPVAAGRAQIASRNELRPPIDQIAVVSMMAELFELERINCLDECAERSELFAEILSGHPYGPVYAVRSLAYRALLDGYAAVKKEMAALKPALAQNDKAGSELKLLEHFYASESNAVISAHSGGQFNLFLDEVPVGSGSSPIELSSFPVVLTPGAHTLRVELSPQPNMPIDWFSLALRTHATNIVTSTAWEYSKTRPEGWPGSDGADDLWSPVARCRDMLPLMACWQFVPNAAVLTQSAKQLVIPWGGWNTADSPTYLRHRFVQPDARQSAAGVNRSKVSAEGEAVRPEGDASNINLE